MERRKVAVLAEMIGDAAGAAQPVRLLAADDVAALLRSGGAYIFRSPCGAIYFLRRSKSAPIPVPGVHLLEKNGAELEKPRI